MTPETRPAPMLQPVLMDVCSVTPESRPAPMLQQVLTDVCIISFTIAFSVKHVVTLPDFIPLEIFLIRMQCCISLWGMSLSR